MRFASDTPFDFKAFCAKQKSGLSRMRSLCRSGDIWSEGIWEWPRQYQRRGQKSQEYAARLQDKLLYHKMTQYFFFKQWEKLKDYANDHGILIIGDLPFMYHGIRLKCGHSRSSLKLMKGNPITVAELLPIIFLQPVSIGDPIYNWENMKKNHYAWWAWRIRLSFELYDVLRIDHFRGFEAYWEVPFGAPDAQEAHGQRSRCRSL